LERKWPDKYNAAGHVTWSGRLYGRGLARTLGWQRERIVYGTWGSAPFQSAYHTAPSLLSSLLLMPEWHILSAGLGALSVLGFQWRPLLIALPLFLLTRGASLIQALVSAAHARFTGTPLPLRRRILLHLLTAGLFLLQPVARLHGRRWAGLRRAWQGRTT